MYQRQFALALGYCLMGCITLMSLQAQVDEVEGGGTDLGLTDEVDGIVHLAISNPHRIRRYDTVKRNWINPIKLSAAPDAIAATSLGTYVAFGEALVIVGTDREEATILRTSSPIISLAKVAEVRTNSGPIIGPTTFKDVLVVVSETELVTYDLSFGREISRRDLTEDTETILPLYHATGSDSARRVYGLHPDEPRLLAYQLTDDGQVELMHQGPTLVLAPQGPLHVDPDGSYVVDRSGRVFSGLNLAPIGDLELETDDITFLKDRDGLVALKGNELFPFDRALKRNEIFSSNRIGDHVASSEVHLFVFSADPDWNQSYIVREFTVEEVVEGAAVHWTTLPESELILGATKALAIHPVIMHMQPEYDLLVRSVSGLPNYPIRLRETPVDIATSPGDPYTYVASASKITRIETKATQPFEIDHIDADGEVTALVRLEEYLFVATGGAFPRFFVYDSQGTFLDSLLYPEGGVGFTAHSNDSRIYFLTATGPQQLARLSISNDGLFEGEPTLSEQTLPNYSEKVHIFNSGDKVIVGKGDIFDANDLSHITSLDIDAFDYVSWPQILGTLRHIGGASQIEYWDTTTFERIGVKLLSTSRERSQGLLAVGLLPIVWPAGLTTTISLFADEPPPPPPPAPEPNAGLGLEIVSHDADGLKLRWNEASSSEVSYSIERSRVEFGRRNTPEYLLTSSNEATVTMPTESNTSATIWIHVFETTFGQLKESVQIIRDWRIPTAGDYDVEFTAVYPDHISLIWVDDSEIEIGYRLEVSINEYFFQSRTTVIDLPPNTTSYVFEDLEPETVYHLRLRALGIDRMHGNAVSFAKKTPLVPPEPITTVSPVSSVSTTTLGTKRTTVTWVTGEEINVDGYRVERSVGDDAFEEIGNSPSEVHEYVDPISVPGESHQYRVTAFSNDFGDGESAQSEPSSLPTTREAYEERSVSHAGIFYLTMPETDSLWRYDLAAGAWLSPIFLPSTNRTLAAAGEDGVYSKTSFRMDRTALDGSESNFFSSVTGDMHFVGLLGDHAIINRDGRYLSIHRELGYYQEESQDLNQIVSASIAPNAGRIVGLDVAGMHRLDLRQDGTTDEISRVSHAAFSVAVETHLSPDGEIVVDEYGAVTRLDGSLGDQLLIDSEFSLIAFAGDASPIVLIGEEIIAFSDLLIETGRLSLSEAPVALSMDGTDLVLFFEDWTGENRGIRADTVPLETLGLLPDGHGVPLTLTFEQDIVQEEALEDQSYHLDLNIEALSFEQVVTLSAFELPEWLTLTDHGDGTATLEGTPSQINADTGSFTIELQAESDAGLTGDLIFELNVTAVNDPPIAQDQTAITLLEDAAPHIITASELFMDEEEPADQLTISVVSFDEALLDATWDLETNALILTPNPEASGDATVAVQSTDSSGLQAEASLTVTITAVPDPPVATQHPGLEIPEDGEDATLTLSDWFSDIDSASLAYEWELPDSAAMLVIGQLNGDELVLSVVPDAHGLTQLLIRALDETDLAAETSVEIVVSPRADAPTAQAVDPLTFQEDALENRVDLAPWFSDGDQDMLSYTIGSLTGDETILDVNVEESELVFRFEKDAFGEVTLGLTATDPGGQSAEIQVPITVAAEPDAPLVIIQELELVTISFEQMDHAMQASAWFADPDPEDTLSYQLEVLELPELFASAAIDPGNGSIALAFTPGAGGTAELRVTATDQTDRQAAFLFQIERAEAPVMVEVNAEPIVLDLDAGFYTQTVTITNRTEDTWNALALVFENLPEHIVLVGAQQDAEGVWTLERGSSLSPGIARTVELRYVDRTGEGIEGIPLSSAKALDGEVSMPEALSVIGALIDVNDDATFHLTFPTKRGELYRLQFSVDSEQWTTMPGSKLTESDALLWEVSRDLEQIQGFFRLLRID